MDKKIKNSAAQAFDALFNVISVLRGPDGCPWDKEQTEKTLRSDLLEETYECIDAINRNDTENLREELGDLYLLTTMISYINEQKKTFTLENVLSEITEKLIRRHPHVFSDSRVADSTEVITQWDRIKREVEGKERDGAILNSVPSTLPPLEKAYRIQKKAAKVGFDWRERSEVVEKIFEELDELQELDCEVDEDGVENELGDLLFAVVNLCRHYHVDPAVALHGTNIKFIKRFTYIEKTMKTMGKTLSKDQFELMDKLWNEAKSLEK